MEELRSTIGPMTLNNMFIPGTHDSGSFHLSYGPFTENRIDKYVYTQVIGHYIINIGSEAKTLNSTTHCIQKCYKFLYRPKQLNIFF